MQKLAVVYFLNINSDEIENFRKRYDPSWNIIPLHITIVSPIPNISEIKFIDHIESITTQVEPFPIHLTGLTKSFDHYLFLQIKEGNEKIIKLHEHLYTGILNTYLETEIPFAPHITLGYFGTKDGNLDNEKYNRALSEAEKLHLDLTCNFDSVTLIKGDGVSPAVNIKKFLLNKLA